MSPTTVAVATSTDPPQGAVTTPPLVVSRALAFADADATIRVLGAKGVSMGEAYDRALAEWRRTYSQLIRTAASYRQEVRDGKA